ncbi:MAG: hypothetical protein LBP85_01915 [Prevotellaceae bacterium]|jgi:hypothetical protein|nr:hypothetical protein [Prevotellaceae bacterium]
MKQKKVSKERKNLEELLIMYLRLYWRLKAIHFEKIDEEINRLVEELKNEI